VAGSGESGPKVVVPAAGPDGYRVRGVDAAPDGDSLVRWVRQNFSTAGAAELDRRSIAAETTAAQARQAFGLPAGPLGVHLP
jgi:hypothetical protein